MKIALTTLGCKVNSYETEAVWEKLNALGHERVDDSEFADVYIINTCMVTNTAEAKSRQMIRHPLKHNPNAIIVVMGCLTQLKAEEILSIEGVKIVVGTKDRDLIPQLLDRFQETKIPINHVNETSEPTTYDNLVINDFFDHQRAFLKIEDGCNNFCSYCIIPYTRGRVRSKKRELVLQEAEALARRHVEIVLTGIHTGGYGEDLDGYSFGDLLEDLERMPKLKRIRISSIEINELTDQVVDVIAASSKFVHHLHVPLQGGSDRILKLMNRKYDTLAYKEKIDSLRKKIPDLSLTTDVIVGFPGETDDDFQMGYDLIKEIGFSELHVFPFSKRSGTVAAKLDEEVPSSVKKDRVHKLLELSQSLSKKRILDRIGQTVKVVVEREKDGYLMGHSREYIHLKFKGSSDLIGSEVDCVVEAEAYPLSLGRLLN
ncbi:MAG: tRNA (N(6)-L-threonylcarbamoyladenosine(37)-C(2))-methylthiotransferase MtaB [Bacilli bacterium]|nr:tRNA (N(6)-L-threonylcarbamoyladenosine(37)-C(2))-methylthiotransferase MtaB [Bacilli bacterium]MBN2696934.1 tRNA (N(6)-L-threonylcarbamoyladenosine(37)-C(2))-methylthiotransferase MtaB [Bacilli bacterium]